MRTCIERTIRTSFSRVAPIPGVNDNFEGAGPDLGAYEYGATVPPLPDAGVPSDGAVFPDGGPAPDAGPGGDAGTGNGSGDTGGCGCRSGGTTPAAPGLLVLLLALGWIRRRTQSSCR